MRLFSPVLVCLLLAFAGGGGARAEDRAWPPKKREDIAVEKERHRRFIEEKEDLEFSLVRGNRLARSLAAFAGQHGYRFIWKVQLDCAATRGRRYKGKTMAEVFTKIGKEYRIKTTIYPNRSIVARPNGKHYFAVCGKHYRVNYEGVLR